MNVFSLIFGIIAAVIFAIAAFWTPEPNSPRRAWNLVPLGLLFSILCFMAQLLILVSDPITISKP